MSTHKMETVYLIGNATVFVHTLSNGCQCKCLVHSGYQVALELYGGIQILSGF